MCFLQTVLGVWKMKLIIFTQNDLLHSYAFFCGGGGGGALFSRYLVCDLLLWSLFFCSDPNIEALLQYTYLPKVFYTSIGK